jgi:perosamine synthetase
LTPTVDDGPPAPFVVPRSPSQDPLARASAALDWWKQYERQSTSSLLGTGAVQELEHRVADLAGQRWGFAVPSGTIALRAALQAVCVTTNSSVIIGDRDWPAAWGAIRDLGALPLKVRLCEDTALPAIDEVAALMCTGKPPTAIVITSRFVGADVDRHYEALVTLAQRHYVAVVEDATDTILPSIAVGGSPISDDVTCISLGSSKPIDGGEGGVICTSNVHIRNRIASVLHPLRQQLLGVTPEYGMALRIHPVAAVMALYSIETASGQQRSLRPI